MSQNAAFHHGLHCLICLDINKLLRQIYVLNLMENSIGLKGFMLFYISELLSDQAPRLKSA